MTDNYGVDPTISALLILQQKGANSNTGDPHLWAHEVGSEAVRRFGVSAKTLMMCTDDFNYGCQHGFFETAATKNQSVGAIAIKLCGQVENDPSFSYKHKFYCYHGAGHGIMQTAEYDLTSALATCDSFPTQMGNQGCWQGVFMEADNVVGDPDGQDKGFSTPADPLAPCNHVAPKYQNECYINIGQGLIRVEKSNVVRASQDCLGAGSETNIKTCMDGLGIIIGNNLWQEEFTNLKGSFIENTWTICQEFPAAYVDRCVFGAVAQINNMDGLNLDRVNQFCQLVSSNIRTWCYQSIGNDIRAETDVDAVIKKCQELPTDYIQACKQGAQIS
jgi:hypothetical protein